MGWADAYITRLQQGETVTFHPRGNSMTPLVRSGQEVTVRPRQPGELPRPGAVVLCRVAGRQYLHKVTAFRYGQVQIGNNHGHVNGWTNLDKVYGIMEPTDA